MIPNFITGEEGIFEDEEETQGLRDFDMEEVVVSNMKRRKGLATQVASKPHTLHHAAVAVLHT